MLQHTNARPEGQNDSVDTTLEDLISNLDTNKPTEMRTVWDGFSMDEDVDSQEKK
ncbi:MAG: hypothetical protein N4A57_02880 [Anaeromicrobium sp.]|jgi:hypothetical protein|uniref:hypothetical protein n=1 Tax=Anaeromicrobium sp. TaxID=1929132 RepID=UPI0025CD4638|nr:hypothetical protein [Anaeromicrobium sp.]MCT4593206.1 hypothetical protein [Anaeromicrobium sp.]